MNIKETDFVLEVGSGHNPKVRADVLCDKYIDDDTQRGGSIIADRETVEADGQYLPFRDKAFDYVICSHVLEHVEDPEKLIHELMRIAPRGYIETPSEIAERLYGWPYHNWLINLIDEKLVIQKKLSPSQFGQLFHSIAAQDRNFARFHEHYHHIFLVRYEWEEKIDYEVLPPDPSPLNLESPQVVEEILERAVEESFWENITLSLKNAIPTNLRTKIKSTLVKRRDSKKKSLQEIVVCPLCKGNVEWLTDKIVCDKCELEYPIINNIPRLSRESAIGSTEKVKGNSGNGVMG